MKRLTTFLILVLLFLTGCNFPGVEPTSYLEDEGATPDSEITNTPSPEPAPTDTAETPPSPTPTELPIEPTITPRVFPTLQPLASGEEITITKIQMFDHQEGWGVGHQPNSGARILFTGDGGHTWEDRTPPDPIAGQPGETDSAWSHFLDQQHAWVIYASRGMPPAMQEKVIWQTEDGGLTWSARGPLKSDGMEDAFLPVGFASVGDGIGWLLVHVGGGMSHDYSYLYQTRDGGISWERVADPYGTGIQSLRNTGITFADADYGWVTKDNLGVMPGAFIEQTNDGGQTWEQAFLPEPIELDWFNESSLCETSQPTFTNEQDGLVIVRCRLPGDIQKDIDWSLTYIYRTHDRAETWGYTQLPTTVDRLVFLDENLGWALGRDHYHTTDGGVTWELVKTVFWDGDFSYGDPIYGWAVARNEGEIALVVTKDAGQTWLIIEASVR